MLAKVPPFPLNEKFLGLGSTVREFGFPVEMEDLMALKLFLIDVPSKKPVAPNLKVVFTPNSGFIVVLRPFHGNLILTISISLEKGSLSMGCVHVSELSLTRSSVFLH